MRYFVFLWIGLLAYQPKGITQTITDTDSIGFEQQRERVNTLLNERSKRFGDFDVSLQRKTGVFGIFKTKGDMQKSIDILKQVVLTDNHIFLETRKLLEIKDNESDRHETLAKEYDEQITAHMRTISKLQAENEQLRAQLGKQDEKSRNLDIVAYLLMGIVIALSAVTFRLYRKKHEQKKNLTQE